jgi:CHAT domain
MQEGRKPAEAVRRALFRDDLLTLAADADRAVGIVRQREDLPRQGPDSPTLFDLALDSQLGLAKNDSRWAIRAQAWDYAAVLVRFCRLVGTKLKTEYTPERLHELALREVTNNSPLPGVRLLDKDLTLGVFIRYHATRDLRLGKRYDEALALVDRPANELYGVGAEPYMAHYLYEVGASHIAQGHLWDVNQVFEKWRDYWEDTRAAGYSTRHRFDFILALGLWNAEPGDAAVAKRLDTALAHLGLGPPPADPAVADSLPEPRDEQGIRELSVLLAAAEYLAGREPSEETCAKAVEFGWCALRITDRVRARWRVIARSRAPLAVVFQWVYGDLALLAARLAKQAGQARLPTQAAAELGFAVALSAKQTGFAARIRDSRVFHGNPHVDSLIKDIVDLEADSSDTNASNPDKRRAKLGKLRFKLAEAVSPMLADTVFPEPVPVVDLVKTIGSRYVLDFVELHDTLDDTPRMFRTLIDSDHHVSFEKLDPSPAFRTHFERGRAIADVARGLVGDVELLDRPDRRSSRDADEKEPGRGVADGQVDWRALAEDVLPRRLTDQMLAHAHSPITLLISAHSWLSLLPWAALKIDDDGTRLVERAVISQCPVLTCLSAQPPPEVRGRALIRLVGKDEAAERGVNVVLERRAWGLTAAAALESRLHECGLLPDDRPEPYRGRFDQAIGERGAWQFLHIASHGGGWGFDQYLDLPGERLSAARALSYTWPASVLMASCHVGLVVNENGAEPLNFVMALLTGGAQCVVAGIGAIQDEGTGTVAGHMVSALRNAGEGGGITLDAALRSAQLSAIGNATSEEGWALLSAYVR